MPRSSKAISLALIGSAVLLGGCSQEEGDEQQWADGTAQGTTTTHTVRNGVFIAPRIGGYGGGYGGGSSAGVAPSVRGGFGGTGSASVGS